MPSAARELHILANLEELSSKAAEEFVQQAKAAVQARGLFTVALSGGSTPKGLYALLASETGGYRTQVPWSKIHFFWGDERHVPPDHPDSNYRMAREAMLSRVPVPPEHIHRIKAEDPDANAAAEQYASELRQFFRLTEGQTPRFDLVLLGLGPDGHTASLFPWTTALHEQKLSVAAVWVEKFKTYRITLTAPVLNSAACVAFLACGEEKAASLQAVLQGAYQPDRFPAQLIRPTNGRPLWLVDRAAARLLDTAGAQPPA